MSNREPMSNSDDDRAGLNAAIYRCPQCEKKEGRERERFRKEELDEDPSYLPTYHCHNCGHNFDPHSDSYKKWASGWYSAQ